MTHSLITRQHVTDKLRPISASQLCYQIATKLIFVNGKFGM
jgi:hypothetical protein